jgi:hypothetical protein
MCTFNTVPFSAVTAIANITTPAEYDDDDDDDDDDDNNNNTKTIKYSRVRYIISSWK